MGLLCFCNISLDTCPDTVTSGESFNVQFLVTVMGNCENCIATCEVPNVFHSCILSTPNGVIPGPSIPIEQGITPVLAQVIIGDCPTEDITVIVTVRCLNEFGQVTCEDSAECVIQSCITP
ncbi:hypothetical protein QNH20_12900 [Neobacillus sp. WH10]|uniref:hypothetical protein n=1 Tax=Neobacillus sp. WH10 TaxID=3047873 RepID=UPI0024C16857|nr:hypothetical protein [Neobacillus sp. WH10]WHY79979.1 hypothetical protein QNH20_12900 [Neobacillus sp. WH10]